MKFIRVLKASDSLGYYVATIDDEYVQGGFDTETEAQDWIYEYCNNNALDPEDYIVYEEVEKE